MVFLWSNILLAKSSNEVEELINVDILLRAVKSADAENHGLIPRKFLINKIKDIELISELDELNKTIGFNVVGVCAEFKPDCVDLTVSTPEYIFDESKKILIKVDAVDGFLAKAHVDSKVEKIFLKKFRQTFRKGYFTYLYSLYFDNGKKLEGFESVTINNGNVIFQSEKLNFEAFTMDPTFPPAPGDPSFDPNLDYCGSAGNGGLIPDYFPKSCYNHDNCYSSGQQKSVCDLGFRDAMEAETQEHRNDLQRYTTMMALKDAYYSGVANLDRAFEAFCDATPNPAQHPECDEQLADYLQDNINYNNQVDDSMINTGNSAVTSAPANSITGGGLTGGSSFTYSCEIWQFPDGDGGYYYMLRNCHRT